MNDFEILSEYANVGFYSSCEIINVFISDNEDKQVHNYYTIIVMSDENITKRKKSYLTKKPQRISKRFSLGILKVRDTKEFAACIYKSLLNNTNCKINLGTTSPLNISGLKAIPKQYVQAESTINPKLNAVLKNNFRSGSYILEFFDLSKDVKKFFTQKEIQEINNKIYDNVPINLVETNDRIGNIIFQFPSQVLSLRARTEATEQKLYINIFRDARLNDGRTYKIIVDNQFDEVLVGHKITEGIHSGELEVTTGNTSGLNNTKIIDEHTGLIVYMQTFSFMSRMLMDMNSMVGERTLQGDRLQISEKSPFSVDFLAPTWMDSVRNRQHETNLKQIGKELKFIQYGLLGSERDKALEDIRTLINIEQKSKIYLWDPYLSAQDILDTLYHSTVYNIELKAISSKKVKSILDDTSLPLWIASQQHLLSTNGNNFGINLEYRIQRGEHGFGFHDRFIVFVDDELNTVKAWSLGTSVNTLGKEHHIFREVLSSLFVQTLKKIKPQASKGNAFRHLGFIFPLQ